MNRFMMSIAAVLMAIGFMCITISLYFGIVSIDPMPFMIPAVIGSFLLYISYSIYEHFIKE